MLELYDARLEDGWVWNGKRYDDAGVSGEKLNRPGLQGLLADIDAGAVQRVVVYRLDRLSRSVVHCAELLQRFWTGGKPTLRTYEMICFYFAGWADLDELTAHFDKLQATAE